MTATRQRNPIRLSQRLAWTVVLVLIALGGAGLTAAADRPATDLGRPELTALADSRARPWLAALAIQARAVAADVDAVNESGRQILGSGTGANPDGIDAALSTGNAASADLDTALAALVALRTQTPAGLDERRMGSANRELLAAMDAIAGGAAPVSETWHALAADTGQVSALLTALTEHVDILARATAAGGNSDWVAALDLLTQAKDALQTARDARDQLAAHNDVSALDDLLDNYATYDVALIALFTAVRDGAAQDSDEVRRLGAAVVDAQAKLPADREALSEFVSGMASAAVADEVVDLETARGIVDAGASSLP